MKFSYQDTEYEFADPDTWSTLEATRLHQASGLKPLQMISDFNELGPTGLHALAWVTVRRAGVNVPWDEFELPYFPTVHAMTGEVSMPPVDPSTASTRPSKAGSGRRAPRAPSKKS